MFVYLTESLRNAQACELFSARYCYDCMTNMPSDGDIKSLSVIPQIDVSLFERKGQLSKVHQLMTAIHSIGVLVCLSFTPLCIILD